MCLIDLRLEPTIRNVGDAVSPCLTYALTSDGKTLISAKASANAYSDGGLIEFWDLPSLERRREQYSKARHLALVNRDSYVVAGCENGTIFVWTVPEGEFVVAMRGPEGGISGLLPDPTGQSIYSIGKQDPTRLSTTLQRWAIPNGNLMWTIDSGPINCWSASADGTALFYGSGKMWVVDQPRLIAIKTSDGALIDEQLLKSEAYKMPKNSVIEDVIIGCNDGAIQFWNWSGDLTRNY